MPKERLTLKKKKKLYRKEFNKILKGKATEYINSQKFEITRLWNKIIFWQSVTAVITVLYILITIIYFYGR